MSSPSLDALYRDAVGLLDLRCRGEDGSLRNAMACWQAMALFSRGVDQLSSHLDAAARKQHEDNSPLDLFTRGRNIAGRAVAQHEASVVLRRTCERAVALHNQNRLVLASLLSLRCEAAARHVDLGDAVINDSKRVVSRSLLLLRATVLPRYRVACAAYGHSTEIDARPSSCAFLVASIRDLCREHGTNLTVALLGAGAAWRAAVVRHVCPGALALAGSDFPRGHRHHQHLVHIVSAPERTANESVKALIAWSSRRLKPGGALLCHGYGCGATEAQRDAVCGGGFLKLNGAETVAASDAPLLPYGCRWLLLDVAARDNQRDEGTDGGGMRDDEPYLIAVNPAENDAGVDVGVSSKASSQAGQGEVGEVRVQITSASADAGFTGRDIGIGAAGSCGAGASARPSWPGQDADGRNPWAVNTFVICTEARRSRWQSFAHPSSGQRADAEDANVTLVAASLASELPESFLRRAYETVVAGVEAPPTDRRYAAHSAAVMLGHLSAWRAAAERMRTGVAFATILEDDAVRTPHFGELPLSALVAELAEHDPSWDMIYLSELPPHPLSHILSHRSHAPELTDAELDAPPTPATRHLMRIAPCTKAVAWVLSRRFLHRLLDAQEASPYFGPVDVWAWRVRRPEDGGAVRAYAPLLPWIEEDNSCSSHHVPEGPDDSAG